MADLREFIPFVLSWEAGVEKRKGENNEALFERAKKSGWGDDPLDSGGATMCGVTIGTYTAYCRRKGYPVPTKERLRAIPYAQWQEIIKTMFWDKWKADFIRSQAVAEILVDWVWASGKPGITRPQKILRVEADGIVGSKTLAAVNAGDPKELFGAIKAARMKFVDDIVARRPSQKKWLRGWKNRINSIPEP